MLKKTLIAGAGLTALLMGGHMAFAQTGQNVDWTSYNADNTGSRFKKKTNGATKRKKDC